MHRDVKPANILLMPDGTVKLTDFGIARAVDGSGHTQTGEVLGTPHYLSPEQALGEPATGASDLYALGVVAHELLTGRRPFDRGTPVATALAQVHDPPPPLPPTVPGGLRGSSSSASRSVPRTAQQRPRAGRAARDARRRAARVLEDAVEVVGEAARSEAEADARPVAQPRPSDWGDPTPTPTNVPVPRNHVHWAWVPGFSVALLAVVAVWYVLAR